MSRVGDVPYALEKATTPGPRFCEEMSNVHCCYLHVFARRCSKQTAQTAHKQRWKRHFLHPNHQLPIKLQCEKNQLTLQQQWPVLRRVYLTITRKISDVFLCSANRSQIHWRFINPCRATDLPNSLLILQGRRRVSSSPLRRHVRPPP